MHWIDRHQHWINVIFQLITRFGISVPYIIAAGLLLLYAWLIAKNKSLVGAAAYFLLAIIISGVLCNVLKIIAGRARPYEFFSDHMYGFYFWQFNNNFWSFPSGHATTAAAIATAGSLLLPRFRWYFLIFMLLVATSRVIVQAHYLSDVMIGSYLGFLTAYWLYFPLTPTLALPLGRGGKTMGC